MSKLISHVRWTDSCGTSRWQHRDTVKSDPKNLDHESVGYVFEETPYSIVLLQSQQRAGPNVDSLMEIPKVAIIERRDYELPDFPDEMPNGDRP